MECKKKLQSSLVSHTENRHVIQRQTGIRASLQQNSQLVYNNTQVLGRVNRGVGDLVPLDRTECSQH